jgi:exosortase
LSIKDDFCELHSKISNRAQLKIIVILILILGLFIPVLYSLIHTWSTDDDYSHGYFVIPIVLFMVWRKRKRLVEAELFPSWGWFPIFLIAALSYIISVVTNFHTLTYFSMMVTIFSLLMFITGRKITLILLWPLLFLIFMFPIPSSYYILITNPLKLMITNISAWIIGLLNIPVLQEGNLLFFANTQLEVAEACSGIRSLYSYIMLGCVIALMCEKMRSRIIILLFTIPLAILVNIIRVTGTGILANYYGPEVAQGFFHEFTGAILFIIGFLVLFGLYYILENPFFHRFRR